MPKKTGATGVDHVITCVFREEIFFEIYRKVQLELPTYGYPPEPPPCRETQFLNRLFSDSEFKG